MKLLFNTRKSAISHITLQHSLLENELRKRTVLFEYSFEDSHNASRLKQGFLKSNDFVSMMMNIHHVAPELIHYTMNLNEKSIKACSALLWLAKRYEVPLFVHIDDIQIENGLSLHSLHLDSISSAHGIGVHSTTTKNFIEDNYPSLRNKVHIVKAIVREEYFSINRTVSPTPQFVFAAPLVRSSGLFEVLDALVLVTRDYPHATIDIFGDGKDKEEFLRSALAMNVHANIHIHSPIDYTTYRQKLSTAWALLYPSHNAKESPLVLAEAMAARVPIISSLNSFIRLYSKEKTHSLVHRFGDSRQLAEHMIELIQNETLRNELSHANTATADGFRAYVVASEYVELYNSILQTTLQNTTQSTAPTTLVHNPTFRIISRKKVQV